MRIMAKLRAPTAPVADDWLAHVTHLLAASVGAEVRLVHPNSTETFLEAHAPNTAAATALAARLRASPHVESAYVKPDFSTPDTPCPDE